jgi:hypothetical protein
MYRLAIFAFAIFASTVLVAGAAGSASAELGFLPTASFSGISASGALATTHGLEIKCTEDTVTGGLMKNDKEGTIGGIAFKGCKALGAFSAQTGGDPTGTILIGLPSFTVGIINKSSLTMGMAIHLSGPLFIEIPAAKSTIVVTGSVIGALTPVAKKSNSFTLAFKGEKGKQAITKFEGGAEETLTAIQSGGKAEAASESTTEELLMNEVVEIMEA